ncbi:hypothetical protein BDP81DRAFT_90735 [Colletotrichum phormii]|uniref:Uncharacterized protein n=1 Tax=Colletotrichum phormii TaxID=359342 RepID=A0AAJ0A2T3_9PEZI|nr:uncharacterized protein BDP81DRAFT_90735 [Colletotrichum phormii]KAK1654908.1 hypothetical protein BDP81DRAFT_90735 [Colletotrichum phormii]
MMRCRWMNWIFNVGTKLKLALLEMERAGINCPRPPAPTPSCQVGHVLILEHGGEGRKQRPWSMAQAPAFFGDPGFCWARYFRLPRTILHGIPSCAAITFRSLPTSLLPTFQPTDTCTTTMILSLCQLEQEPTSLRHGRWQLASSLSTFTLAPGIPADAFAASRRRQSQWNALETSIFRSLWQGTP